MKTLRRSGLSKRPFQVAFLAILFLAGAAQSKDNSEYLIKAGFLYNFSKFIQWPAACFSESGSPFVLGIYGENPFGESIFLLEKEKVNGHPVEVRIIPDGARPSSECHMIFIPDSQRKNAMGLIRALKNRPVVLVGETPDFARIGGMINFYVKNDRVAFEVNSQAVRDGQVEISSRLLKLARIIDGDPL